MNAVFFLQLVEFIAGLAILIILHELGHFLMSKWLGVEVEEFGIGFPPRLATLFRSGGTDFTLNAIPLGGFVRPKGENDPSVEGGLAAASPWVRLAVLFAGPLMNLLAGLALGIAYVYSVGQPITSKVLIEEVVANSPAQSAGLKSGDLITQVNGVKIDSMTRLQETISANLGKPVEIIYQRGDQSFTTSLTPRNPPPPDQGAIGIVMSNPTRAVGFGEAISTGARLAGENIRGILILPLRLIQGNASPQEGRIVGYKGMFDIFRQIPNPLGFFMAISISLGVINLFPVPALDGGRILLTLPEIIVRRRIPPQYENVIHLVGFTLLLILLIYVNVQDFLNPIQFSK